MRVLAFVVVVLCVVPAGRPALAQEPETLKKEIEALRKQLQSLSERLQRLEAQPPPAAPSPVAVQAPPAPPAPAGPSTLDLARPRQPFALYERRGPGQLLFDVGVSADFTGNLTQRNVDKANAGSFPGRENRFFPREIELNLFGQIDPYAQGVVRIEAGEDEAGADARVTLAEASLTLLTLPGGTQLRLGQVRSRFGLLNEHHRDGLPQPDVPNVLLRFLGEEGLVERGAELSWVAPFPFFLEAVAGAFDGDNETAFGRGKLNEPLVTGRLRTFFEPTDAQAIQLGLSGAHGLTAERRRSALAGFDLKYKWRPEGWRHPLLTLGGEALYSFRRVDVDGDTRERDRFGWYAWSELQPWQRWALGVRYDSTQFPVNPGREWAVEPYVTFALSEFLRFRLGYKHTERSHRDGFTDNDASARLVDELLFQATFLLGAHPAHPF